MAEPDYFAEFDQPLSADGEIKLLHKIAGGLFNALITLLGAENMPDEPTYLTPPGPEPQVGDGKIALLHRIAGAASALDDALAEVGGGGGSVTPYDAGNITGTTTLDYANGAFQKASLTGNVTLAVPSNGAEGTPLRLLLTASGADRTLSLNGSILLPTDSGIAFPKSLTSGKKYVVLLQHNGTAWMLISLVGGF